MTKMERCPKCKSKNLSMEHGNLVCNDCEWKAVDEDGYDDSECYCDCTNEDCDFCYQIMNPNDPCPKCGSKVKLSYIVI